MEYADVPSAIKPVAHEPGIAVPEPPRDFAEFDSRFSANTEDKSNHNLWAQQSCAASSS